MYIDNILFLEVVIMEKNLMFIELKKTIIFSLCPWIKSMYKFENIGAL